MALKLGLDTGGTYTDAVIYDDDKGVLAEAKSLTTKHDLAIGLRGAAKQVLAAGHNVDDIQLVSISTTLATNAIVESHGAPACLVMIGFDDTALERGGLGKALNNEPVIFVEGGHRAQGYPQSSFDSEGLRQAISNLDRPVSAFAVAGRFAVRNSSHEIEARDLIREMTGLPVTCSHELASDLDAPRRAVTALLNARLIFLLQQLIEAVQEFMVDQKIKAPLMVVQGDGSLISSEAALARPVETVLSGPAASLVGAARLTGLKDMVISDMGGTTTDVAILKDGAPVLNDQGASVGGFRTFVRAVDVHTFGLGGDSQISWSKREGLRLGPRRVMPLSLLVKEYPQTLELLQEQVAERKYDRPNGVFVLRLRTLPRDQEERLTKAERQVWNALAEGPRSMLDFEASYLAMRAMERLENRGLVIRSSLTPSDAAHVLGWQDTWAKRGAELGMEIYCWERELEGWPGRDSIKDFATEVAEQVTRQTAWCLTASTLDQAGAPALTPHTQLANWLVAQATNGQEVPGLMLPTLALQAPLVGIGGPAELYYTPVAERLKTNLVIPEAAKVCNAVGAVAASVARRLRLTITAPTDALYRVHVPTGNKDFKEDLPAAVAFAHTEASRLVTEAAQAAGADSVEISLHDEKDIIEDDGGKETFIEWRVFASASGRPKMGIA